MENPTWLPPTWHQYLPIGTDERSLCVEFLRKLGEELPDPLAHLIALIDDSRYGQAQWFAAIAYFSRWMQEQHRTGSVAHQLDYIRGSYRRTTDRFRLAIGGCARG